MSRITSPRPPRRIILGSLAGAVLLLLAASGLGAQPLCVQPPVLTQTGPNGFPAERTPFPRADHMYLHSSTHLQGTALASKWAGGLLWNMPTSTGFDGFSSAVVVNNPDLATSTDVRISYFDHLGNAIGMPATQTIQAGGQIIEAAQSIGAAASMRGIGTARIDVIGSQDPPIVGATLMHTRCVAGICDQDRNRMGANSMQQLQHPQQSTLYWGPLPVTRTSPVDFFNGNLPFLMVVNPNASTARVRVDVAVHDRVTGAVFPFLWRDVDLPARGTLLEKNGPHLGDFTHRTDPGTGLWDWVLGFYGSLTPPYDFDLTVVVSARDAGTGLPVPILGDGVMTDFYGDSARVFPSQVGGPPTSGTPSQGDVSDVDPDSCSDGLPCGLWPGARFRMASQLLAPAPSATLVSPDFSFDVPPVGGTLIQTLIGISNVGSADAGPVVLEYFSPGGALVSSFSVTNLLPGQTLRLRPGVLGYPTTQVGIGWVRVRACLSSARLTGWSVREILDPPNHPLYAGRGPGFEHDYKAFGETLQYTAGGEPGLGYPVFSSTGVRFRKVSPVVYLGDGGDWPGYTELVKDTPGNLGAWDLAFRDQGGLTCGSAAYAGLQAGFTAWTYEDPISICPFRLQTGFVTSDTPYVSGIDVIGDPMVEYPILGYPNRP